MSKPKQRTKNCKNLQNVQNLQNVLQTYAQRQRKQYRIEIFGRINK